MQFYVYLYIDPRTDTPFYAGKGSGRRARDFSSHNHNSTVMGRLKQLKDCGLTPIIEYCQINSELSAMWMERLLISAFGRKDQETGVLFNHTNGGEGVVGHRWSDEARQKMSLQRKGKKAWNKGFTNIHSPEGLLGVIEGGRNGGNKRKGKPTSQKQKEAVRISSKARKGEKRLGQGLLNIQRAVAESNKIIVTCPRCMKTGQSGGMRKYHFNNCRKVL